MRGAGAARAARRMRELFALATSAERSSWCACWSASCARARCGRDDRRDRRGRGTAGQRVRRALMYAKNLGAVARAALLEGETALASSSSSSSRRSRRCWRKPRPIRPTRCASSAARRRSNGRWTARASRCTSRRATVRIYTRNLNDVSAAMPEIVEAVRALPARDLILDGEAIAFDAPRPAASVPDHDAPLRPQARCREAARRAADARVLLRLPAHRRAQPRRSPDARAHAALAAGRAGSAARSRASSRRRPTKRRRSTTPRSRPATKA